MHLSRRLFLIRSAALASAVYARPQLHQYPFALGVMSGDPSPDGFVLWTRLAPDPLNGGGMAPDAVAVDWIVAEDESLRKVVQRGQATASPQLAHSVHVEVEGLRPGRPYWYQFKAAGDTSPIGRAITMPQASDMAAQLRFAFASCQNWETGLWTAYDHMLADDPSLVVHLGDYIYENGGRDNRVRKHVGAEIKSLADYRNRHAQYKTDASIQKMHAHCPWIVTWDDHEVDNNYAAEIAEYEGPRADFLERRSNAYQAYYEHMPLRLSSMPRGSHLQLYRDMDIGRLVRFQVLDTRQYRTDQPCGDDTVAQCPGAFDPAATMLGAAQEAWLQRSLDRSPARWNILANQVQVAKLDMRPGAEEAYSMDKWSGYEPARTRLLQFLAERQPSNPIVITGDIHSNWVSDLKADWGDEKSPAIGTEFTGTSISSAGDGLDEDPDTQGWYRDNPHLKMFNGRRGYVMMTLDAKQCRADYRIVPFVSKPGALVHTHSSWIIENGKRGVHKL